MSLPLPRLDDRTYADLVEEARALIPSLRPAWTDHNPTDPGITLIELLAWLTEMLLYRLDQLPEAHLRVFLALLNDPEEWEPGADLDEDIRRTLETLRRRYRAVTADDWEGLAREGFEDSDPERGWRVARAWCVARRNLDALNEAKRQDDAPGHVSLIVLPEEPSDPATPSPFDPESRPGVPLPSWDFRREVWSFFDGRRLLTTRHHVVGPIYAPVGVEILLARRDDVDPAVLGERVLEAVTGFFDPFSGGIDGAGWPLGRDVHVSELYQLLEGVAGVDWVPDIRLASACPAEAPSCEPATVLWHDSGDQIGLRVAAHHLPWALLSAADLASSASFVPVRLTVSATLTATAVERDARRRIKEEVRRLFHPLHGGGDGTEVWEITLLEIRTVLLTEVDELDTLEAVELAPGPGIDTQGVRLEIGEIADVRTDMELAA